MTQIDQDQFKWVGKAAAGEDTRFALASVCIDKGQTLVATDGRRLHVAPIEDGDQFPKWREIVPADFNCTATIDAESLFAVAKSVCATVKNVDRMDAAVCQIEVKGQRAELRLIEPHTVAMSWIVDIEHKDTDGKLLLNPSFLRDALDKASGGCALSALIEPDGYCKNPIRLDRADGMWALMMPISKEATLALG